MPFANGLLTDVSGRDSHRLQFPLLRLSKQIKPLGCCCLQAWEHMGVSVQGRGDAGVAEAFLYDLGMDALL